ncbi:sodium-dependent bicarbonate transport family permease [Planctomicrobium sp. SH527]|uniref:sodium-dependent bicarbonate transport family permease n=1 Tax=Planctomicrobium sp. SH527 TaxID=3448123 RepID=UPI003F5C6290
MVENLLSHFALLASGTIGSTANAVAGLPIPSENQLSLFQEFGHNFIHNLFKPLLLFFYAGFLIPILRVKFEFPKVLYQSITIYLLVSIGWHGGEELAKLSSGSLMQALGFVIIGIATNFTIGFIAYLLLRSITKLRRVDAATVAGYYGSDSAGTFVTCVGVLTASKIAFAPYMPVMLAVMEIPGCLVALLIVSRLRQKGMDSCGNMPDEFGYVQRSATSLKLETVRQSVVARERNLTYARSSKTTVVVGSGPGLSDEEVEHNVEAEQFEDDMALREHDHGDEPVPSKKGINGELLHEVFFNPGIYLLFAGIVIGFISRLQGSAVTTPDDRLFVDLFPPILCLFLLEMGMTASNKLKDLAIAGWKFVAFALLAPNVFATIGILIAHAYSVFLNQPFEIGTYALFAVLCGSASYIALPAVQRMAIPEASPTLPLAASLGCTFSYNVTVGIPVYILIAKLVTSSYPVAGQLLQASM